MDQIASMTGQGKQTLSIIIGSQVKVTFPKTPYPRSLILCAVCPVPQMCFTSSSVGIGKQCVRPCHALQIVQLKNTQSFAYSSCASAIYTSVKVSGFVETLFSHIPLSTLTPLINLETKLKHIIHQW